MRCINLDEFLHSSGRPCTLYWKNAKSLIIEKRNRHRYFNPIGYHRIAPLYQSARWETLPGAQNLVWELATYCRPKWVPVASEGKDMLVAVSARAKLSGGATFRAKSGFCYRLSQTCHRKIGNTPLRLKLCKVDCCSSTQIPAPWHTRGTSRSCKPFSFLHLLPKQNLSVPIFSNQGRYDGSTEELDETKNWTKRRNSMR